MVAKGRVYRYQTRKMRGGKQFLQREKRRGAIAILIFCAVWLNVKCYEGLYVQELDAAVGMLQTAFLDKSVKERRIRTKTESEEQSVNESFDNEILLVEYQKEEESVLAVSRQVGKLPKFQEETKQEETKKEETKQEEKQETAPPAEQNNAKPQKIDVKEVLLERFGSLKTVRFQDFISNYYVVDASTKAVEADFPIERLAGKNVSIKKKNQPQILIYHTHGSEAFSDSRPGKTEDTVIGAGELLAKYLREDYGFQVIHVTEVFDRKPDGRDDRDNAYNNTLPVIRKVLEENPGIEVVIDLHRDSGEARRATINGKGMAKIMLFNGLCRTKDGPISYYSNQNLTGNLAFSLQTQVTGNELFPGLMHRIYLKSYRYNMHLKERYLLVELGTQKNTTAEAMASMKPFAEILAAVLSEE